MEDQAPVLQTGAARPLEAQKQATTTSVADIVIFCHPRNVANLVQAFETEIEHAAGTLPMYVFWSGVSGLLHQGVIVLRWEGTISPAFLKNLTIDHEIFDFVIYKWVKGEREQGRNSQKEKRIEQSQESNEVADEE